MDDEEDLELPEIPVVSSRMQRPKHRERGSKSKQASSLMSSPQTLSFRVCLFVRLYNAVGFKDITNIMPGLLG